MRKRPRAAQAGGLLLPWLVFVASEALSWAAGSGLWLLVGGDPRVVSGGSSWGQSGSFWGFEYVYAGRWF